LTTIAVITITKHGIEIARRIKSKLPEADLFGQAKFTDSGSDIRWFTDPTTKLVGDLFRSYDALICVFSLGAVIRLIAPHLVDKKTDPAVLVIDDRANHVISALSGHIGGANALTKLVAAAIGAQPVITTAADVNETIAVDLVGREYGWIIEDNTNVTRVSAFMVNEEKVALYQDSGEVQWSDRKLPGNVVKVGKLEDVLRDEFKGALVISDGLFNYPKILEKSVIYRPKSLVIGIGLHWDTPREVIESGVVRTLTENGLSAKSIRNLASVNRGAKVKGLEEFASEHSFPIEIYEKDALAAVQVPNPSSTVQKFEGTASVAEAASLLSSKGNLVVPKQKFPPNLTVAVSRVQYQ
jgi:cobalt-precorrin 5A hydrolase